MTPSSPPTFEHTLWPGDPALKICRLGFGAMGFGGHFGTVDREAGVAAVHRALEAGLNFIDTARAYGPSEEVVGEALSTWKGARPFLATKAMAAAPPAGHPAGAGWQSPLSIATSYPPGSIRASLETSLKALRVDRVDLLQLHQYWAHWPDDAWHEELAALKREGLARFIGVSVPDHRHDLAIPLVRLGLVDSVQTIINIFDPLALDCLAPLCARHGVALIARCILDEGGLAGAIHGGKRFEPGDWLHGYFDCLPRSVYLERVENLRAFTPEPAASLAELAVRYVLGFPEVTVALSSMHISAHLDSNRRALAAGPLPPEVMNELRHRHRWVRNFYQGRRYAKPNQT